MSPPEVGHRILATLRSGLQARGMLLASPVPPRIPASLGLHWFYGVAGLRDAQIEIVAKKLLGGQLPVFAHQARFEGGHPVWNCDPSTGKRAPLRVGGATDIRDARIVGDIKYVWELNRHLDLVAVAQAFARTGDSSYAEGVRNWIESWLDQCPYPLGVNWASGLEAGIRLINWSLTWQLMGGQNSPCFTDPRGEGLLKRWLDSVYQHVHFIRHSYSCYSSANNHLIGEAAGIYVASCTWPLWTEFEKWGEEARCILIHAAREQTHSDGVNREQAVAYQQFVLDFFILSALAGRARGEEYPESYWRAIERMLEYLAGLMDVRGNVPMIGDADDGFVVRLSHEPGFCPYKSLLATGAILFERPDLAVRSGHLDDKTRFLVGEDGWADLLSRAGRTDRHSARQFPEGGYYILGQDIDRPEEIRLIVDAGPLGYLSIAGHGHADALAVWVSVSGKEFLIDPGTYTYHGQPEWRAWFRGTRAHNTVTVDGEDQSVQGGSFMWLKHAQVHCLRFETRDDEELFIGEHNGYRRLRDPVGHRREIRRNGPVFEITDILECKGKHEVEQWWHFSEFCEVKSEDGEIQATNQGAAIRLRAAQGKVDVFRSSENPTAGWVSRRFDVKVPSTSVRVRSAIRGTTRLLTIITCNPG